MVPLWGVTIFAYVNLWYVRAFGDMMPLDMLLMPQNMDDKVVDGAIEQLVWTDIWLVVPALLTTTVCVLWRKRFARGRFSADTGFIALVVGLLMSWAGFKARAAEYADLQGFDVDQAHAEEIFFDISGKRCYMQAHHYWRLGLLGYLWYQAESTFFERRLTAEERARVDNYVNARLAERDAAMAADTDRFSANRGKNLIFIIVESLAAEAPEMLHGGQPIAPTLAALMSDSTAIVFDHVIPQTNHGRSSDGQFIYNTGMLPLRQAVLAKRYPRADYPSLAKALEGYVSAEVTGEHATFYNRSYTSRSFGFDKLIHGDAGEWSTDDIIFAKSIDEAKSMAATGRPFMMLTVSLTMHDPYEAGAAVPTDITMSPDGLDPRAANYLERVNEFDARLNVFLEQLKANGLYDNSIIVIASDHEPRMRCLPDGFITNNILFIALNTGVGFRDSRIIGQVDVFPMVLDLMGVNNYSFPGLGRNPLRQPQLNAAKDAFGTMYGSPDNAESSRLEEAWQVSELMVTGGVFK